MNITYQPIGFIKTPFKTIEGMPIQPAGARSIRGSIEIKPEFSEGLKDLDGFSHIILLYHFHRTRKTQLIVRPFMDSQPRGVFSTRAPNRPNPIGLSIVKLIGIEGNTLHIENVDTLDGTPLLDIKPYVPKFDAPEGVRTGWLETGGRHVTKHRSDDRFT